MVKRLAQRVTFFVILFNMNITTPHTSSIVASMACAATLRCHWYFLVTQSARTFNTTYFRAATSRHYESETWGENYNMQQHYRALQFNMGTHQAEGEDGNPLTWHVGANRAIDRPLYPWLMGPPTTCPTNL